MISFPNAKINLGLYITSKRSDGYHDIESCFYPIPWLDVLEIIPSKELKFTSSGISVPGSIEDNLCLKAYHLLKTDFDIPNIDIHLHKVIPIGAGLGDGSSDAAFTLKMLNEKFELDINTQQLENYAAQLGSDCSFFVKNKPVLATKTGIEFSDINIDLTGKHLVIVKPNIHISTLEAYASISPKSLKTSVREIIENYKITEWRSSLHNDFEDSIFKNHPKIESIKNEMYKKDAIYASMTGSGSAVYGIFEQPVDMEIKNENHSFSTYL